MALVDLVDLDEAPGRALVSAASAMGFSPQVSRKGLEAEFEAWTAPGAVDVLTRCVDTAQHVPATVLIIAARRSPAATVRAVFLARLLGSKVLLRPAAGEEPYAQAIARADAGVTVTPFPSRDRSALAKYVAMADCVVMFGSDESVASVRPLVPTCKTFVDHGHRFSVALLEDPSPAALEGLAHDLCAWDQSGCLSPQTAWIRAPDLFQVGMQFVGVLQEVEREYPVSKDQARACNHRAARLAAEIRGAALHSASSVVSIETTPEFRPSPGGRVLALAPGVPDLGSLRPWLACVGYSGNGRAIGVDRLNVRVCPCGSMQRPPLDWRQSGHHPLLAMCGH